MQTLTRLRSLGKAVKPMMNIVKRQPVLAIFEINLSCNSQCGYCDLPLNEGRYEMSREEIHRVFSHLYEQGLRFILLQGGEPTLRKDLLDIIGDLDALGFQITLVTNGTRLSKKFIERLSRYPVAISISLDTLDKDRYQTIRGANQLPLVLNGIERLKDYPHPCYLTCIVSDINRNDVHDVVEFANKINFIPVVGAYHWDIDRYGKSDLVLQYKKEAARQVFRSLIDEQKIPKGYFRNYVKDNLKWLDASSLSACDAGRYSIAIDSSGNVAPCLALKHQGNLLHAPLNTILQGFDREEVARCSNQSSCNMMCSRVIGSNLRDPVSIIDTLRMPQFKRGKLAE